MKFRVIWTLALLLVLVIAYILVSNDQPKTQPHDSGNGISIN